MASKIFPFYILNLDEYFLNLTVETVFIVRHYCQFVDNTKERGEVENLLPEVKKLIAHVERFVNIKANLALSTLEAAKNFEFILRQLFHTLKLFDYRGDEVARRMALALIREFMLNSHIPNDLLPDLVLFLKTVLRDDKDETELILFVISIIQELREMYDIFPITHEQKEQKNCSHQISSLISEMNSDIQLLMFTRCLCILKALFYHLEVSTNSVRYLFQIIDMIVIPSINSEIQLFQTYGLECLAFVCLLYRPLALQYFSLFFEYFDFQNSKLKIISIQVNKNTYLILLSLLL